MPRIVSSIKKHITTTEFWRALSFVLKRLESIAKYLTKLPLLFTFSLYILHLIRAGLRIYSYFYKTKNKNLGNTFRCLFAVLKVTLAVIALVLLGCGLVSLPSVLLASFFIYSILKLINSLSVLLVSTVSYLKIDKNCIEQQWRRAQYQNNMTKHAFILSAGLMFILLTSLLNAEVSILIWSNPLLLLADLVIVAGLIATAFYLGYKFAKNRRTAREYAFFSADQIASIKKNLLMFGLCIVALLLTAATPGLGASAIILALIVLCVQDVLLTVYYYFYGVYIPNPEPANLSEEQLNAGIDEKRRDFYQTFSPIYYLQTQPTEKLPRAEDVNKANKKLLLKVAFVKLLELENKLEKISKLNTVSQFFSSQKKLNIKKEYLLRELAWALNTDDQEVLIDLFILAIISLPENKKTVVLENNLRELLDLLDIDRVDFLYAYHHPQRNKNLLAKLFFMLNQEKFSEQIEIAKPEAFYQSFWKKVGACDALSQAFHASRSIEEQISTHPSWQPI
ncbi:MAG: hypothetical protein WA659_03820 [Candidatus Aquirickettsiella sp.]